jgi:hypothetical protein
MRAAGMGDAARLKDDIVAVLEGAERPLSAAEIVGRAGRARPGQRITSILLALRREGRVRGESNGSGHILWSWVGGPYGAADGTENGRGDGTGGVRRAGRPPAPEAVALAWAVLGDWFRWIDDDLGKEFVSLERRRWRRLTDLVERRGIEERAADIAAEAG